MQEQSTVGLRFSQSDCICFYISIMSDHDSGPWEMVVTTGDVTDVWQLPLYFPTRSPRQSYYFIDSSPIVRSIFKVFMKPLHNGSYKFMESKITLFFLYLVPKTHLHFNRGGNRNFSDPTPDSLVIIITTHRTISILRQAFQVHMLRNTRSMSIQKRTH